MLAVDVDHGVLSMRLAVHRHLSAPDIKARTLHARGMYASLGVDVDHAVMGMLLAVHRRLAAPDIKGRELNAGFV